ncbi:MAG: hypothetical protein IKS19_03230 [Clostridia bacterium]|nr:hypothetical protein [Clostridia bacterium]
MYSGFFDSVVTGTDENGNPEYDRIYDSYFLTRLLASVIPNGITQGSFVPSRGAMDMTVSVRNGSCFINGCFGTQPTDVNFTIPTSSAARTDLIVLRLDNSERSITLTRKQGTVELTRNSTVYEMAVASVFVEANTDRLGENAVTDLRADPEKCGFISFGPSGSAIGDTGSYVLPQSAEDTRQNCIVVRGADGLICGTVENSDRISGRSIYVQQNQPSSPNAGDLWFW